MLWAQLFKPLAPLQVLNIRSDYFYAGTKSCQVAMCTYYHMSSHEVFKTSKLCNPLASKLAIWRG
jgi:hypothetical protein